MVRYLLHDKGLTHPDRLMLAAAFTLAFYGFLRVSEFTTPPHSKFNPRFHPSTSHVRLHRRHYTFHIPHSKTDQLHQGHTIRVCSTNSASICPVGLMRTYLDTRSSRPGPLFTFADGQPLTRFLCLYYLRTLLKHSGHDPEKFNTHSFRIGAATTAAHVGLSESTIKHLGRWRSSAVRAYIRPYPAYY